MKKLKVGYCPYSLSMDSPCDRRRFPYFAKLRGHDLELYRSGEYYDLVVISTQSDLSYWKRQKSKCPLILDMADGYLSHPLEGFLDRAKAFYKFARGGWSYLESSYSDTLRDVAQAAQAVVCASLEQSQDVLPFNPRVFHVLDFHGSEFSKVKSEHEAHKPFRLVWEGIGDSLYGFSAASRALAEVSKIRPVELHILTDLRFRRMNRPFAQCSAALVEKLLPGVKTRLYQWNRSFFGEIVCGCDLAIIPMQVDNPMIKVKPENRLLLFWKMGVPVLASDTSAYKRVLEQSGLSACASHGDWVRALVSHIDDLTLRLDNVQRGANYIQAHCSDPYLADSWDDVLESVL